MRSALLRSIASSLRKKLHCWPMLAKAVEGLRGHWSMADVGNLHVRWSRSSVGCWSVVGSVCTALKEGVSRSICKHTSIFVINP